MFLLFWGLLYSVKTSHVSMLHETHHPSCLPACLPVCLSVCLSVSLLLGKLTSAQTDIQKEKQTVCLSDSKGALSLGVCHPFELGLHVLASAQCFSK